MRRSILCFSLVPISLPLSVQSEQAGFQRDPVEYYGTQVLTWILMVGICLVLLSLIRYRGRVERSGSWVLLVAGVGMLPLMSLSFGTILVFSRAKRVEFCASCHAVMQSYVDDMKNPKSGSLAAIHYKNRYIESNQCYVCHTSYGLFGTVQAKAEGMIDVYKYYTRTYHFPLKMRHPYPNADCLKCHAGAIKWEAAHEDKESIFSGEDTCMQCHGEDTPAHTLGPAHAVAFSRGE